MVPPGSFTAHVQDDLGVDHGGGEQVRDVHALIGAVEVGDEAGHAGPEGHAAGDAVDVGPAADGDAVALPAAVQLVGTGQGLQKWVGGRDVVGRVDLALHGETSSLQGGLGGQADGGIRAA